MTPKKTYKGSKTALLLTGGGARAAYQVGVLSAIAKFVPRNHGIPFPILSGTSAGAINTTALACYASCFHLGVKKLEWIWKNLTCDRIYRTNTSAVFNNIFSGFAAGFQADYALKSHVACLITPRYGTCSIKLLISSALIKISLIIIYPLYQLPPLATRVAIR